MFGTSDIAQQGGVLSFGTPKCTHYNNDVTSNPTLNIRKTIYNKSRYVPYLLLPSLIQ